MAFSLGCFACCVPCDPCDAVCSETAVGFEVVYSGNTTDGYLTWSGTANPVNAVPPVTGPYNAQITGTFSMPGDDFPCYARLRLWRNIFAKNPGATETLSKEQVLVTANSGKVNLGTLTLNTGESVRIGGNGPDGATYWLQGASPFLYIAAEDDQSGAAPAQYQLSMSSQCNQPANVTITARIEWTDDDIHHWIYGHLMECFEDPPDPPGGCKIDCDGTQTDVASQVYLALSSQVDDNSPPSGYAATFPNITGTFTLPQRACRVFLDAFSVTNGQLYLGAYYGIEVRVGSYPYTAPSGSQPFSAQGYGFIPITAADYDALLCGDVATLSGSGSVAMYLFGAGGGSQVSVGSIAFDWELSL